MGRALAAALSPLLAGFDEGQRRGCSRRDFGASRQQLNEEGVADTRLVDLMVGGILERSRDLFMLTPAGAREVRRALAVAGADGVVEVVGPVPDQVPVLPHYDADLRRLTYGGLLVKELPDAAVNQEVVLLAFEEEGWPRAIDDPLPGVDGLDPRQRLKDTVTRLNHCQREVLMVFHRCGRSSRVWWEVAGGEAR
jgi:hypothetical protein